MNLTILRKHYKKNREQIKRRLGEFCGIDKNDIFYELCFCLLTPQSNAKKCWEAVLRLKDREFHIRNRGKKEEIEKILKDKTRFYKNKSTYLIECRKQHHGLLGYLDKIEDVKEKREFLVKKIKGIGYKEASHFLRNIGYKNLAILDRHILKNLLELRIIEKIPKSLNKEHYLNNENKLYDFSTKIGIPMDELDLLFWSFETGEVFK